MGSCDLLLSGWGSDLLLSGWGSDLLLSGWGNGLMWAHVISCYQDGGVGSCDLLLSFFVTAFDMLFPTSVGKSKDTMTTAFKFVKVTHNHTFS